MRSAKLIRSRRYERCIEDSGMYVSTSQPMSLRLMTALGPHCIYLVDESNSCSASAHFRGLPASNLSKALAARSLLVSDDGGRLRNEMNRVFPKRGGRIIEPLSPRAAKGYDQRRPLPTCSDSTLPVSIEKRVDLPPRSSALLRH